jgi:tRNA pseudouridine38-40 synthase
MYDGSKYHGWQVQNHQETVQGVLEKKLSLMHKRKVVITGSGRTDSGVHATDQYAHFDSDLNLSPNIFLKALNSLLPTDIRCKNVFLVPADFHARYQAYERCYHYVITTISSPFFQSYSHFVHCKHLHADLLEQYALQLEGTHDFFTFSKFNPDIPNTICHVKKIRILHYKNSLIISIRADRFLHNMVRRMAGAMIQLSRDKANPNIVADLFEKSIDYQKYHYTLPPQGLYLVDVKYPISLR